MNDDRERLREEAKPILDELAAVGMTVVSVWEIRTLREPYPAAIPVLLRHIARPYAQKTLAGLALALATPDAYYALDEIVAAYRRAPHDDGRGLKDGLAVAISAIVKKSDLQLVLGLIFDETLGSERTHFIRNLRKWSNRLPLAAETLDVLARNRIFAKAIAKTKSRNQITP